MAEFYDRTLKLIGIDGYKKLNAKKVIIFGCGGVGGYVIEALARSGIGTLGICDFDIIDISNINRQIIAGMDNIGNLKTNEFKKRIENINPSCKVILYSERYGKNNDHMLKDLNWDFCVDAIDSIDDKVSLIINCKNKNIEIISSMGAGNSIEIPDYKITDIYKTQYDKLSKVLRKKLKDAGISALNVCCTNQPCLKTEDGSVGSIIYVPAMCGMTIAGYVINKLLKD